MKRLTLCMVLVISYIGTISCMDAPLGQSTPTKKRSISVFRASQEGVQPPAAADVQTSPAKGVILSPEGKKRLGERQGLVRPRQLFPTGYTDTEHESEIDRQFERIPVLTLINNRSNYPILVGLPDTEAQDIDPKDKLTLKDLHVITPKRIIMNVNNRIHTITYLARPNEQYYLHTINKGMEYEIKPLAKRVKIVIDENGNVFLKSAMD